MPKRQWTIINIGCVTSQKSKGLINNIFRADTLQHAHISRHHRVKQTQTDVHSIWRLSINRIAEIEYQRNTDNNWLGVNGRICLATLQAGSWDQVVLVANVWASHRDGQIWQFGLFFLSETIIPWYVVVIIQTHYLQLPGAGLLKKRLSNPRGFETQNTYTILTVPKAFLSALSTAVLSMHKPMHLSMRG